MVRLLHSLRQFVRWLAYPRYRLFKVSGFLLIAVPVLYFSHQLIGYLRLLNDPRNRAFRQWSQGEAGAREELVTTRAEACSNAPFILPADGFIGLLYADPRPPYSRRNPHQGIDIFSNSGPGTTPVYAAYDGYVTREESWQSSLIMRVPEDPLQPGRTIWLYYTHMADEQGNDFIDDAFPPGTRGQFVEQGTLLGYTGDYNGGSPRTVWVHLHFSIVKDDGNGRYLNELDFENTLDPSRYLGLAVHYDCASMTGTGQCTPDPTC